MYFMDQLLAVESFYRSILIVLLTLLEYDIVCMTSSVSIYASINIKVSVCVECSYNVCALRIHCSYNVCLQCFRRSCDVCCPFVCRVAIVRMPRVHCSCNVFKLFV